MKVVGIIVSRNGSTRIPGKAVLEFANHPLLWHIIRIAKQIKGLDTICLATSTLEADDILVNIAKKENIKIFRGDAEKVLDRVYGAADYLNADAIVYIGGDCPLLDPFIISTAIEYFKELNCDYLNNYDPPTFPEGLDINILSFKALKKAFENAIAPSQRIHAFSYLTFHSEEFTIRNFVLNNQLIDKISEFHWSLDYPEDIDFIKSIYHHLYNKYKIITINDIIKLLELNSEINEYNKHLMKPKVKHAFFTSIGIMSDINNDIVFLCKKALDPIKIADFFWAEICYKDIYNITNKLTKIC